MYKRQVLTVDGTKYTLSVDNATAPCITGGSYKATAQNMIDHALKVDAGVFTNTKLYANGTAVSYTHLDVYKRQTYQRRK